MMSTLVKKHMVGSKCDPHDEVSHWLKDPKFYKDGR